MSTTEAEMEEAAKEEAEEEKRNHNEARSSNEARHTTNAQAEESSFDYSLEETRAELRRAIEDEQRPTDSENEAGQEGEQPRSRGPKIVHLRSITQVMGERKRSNASRSSSPDREKSPRGHQVQDRAFDGTLLGVAIKQPKEHYYIGSEPESKATTPITTPRSPSQESGSRKRSREPSPSPDYGTPPPTRSPSPATPCDGLLGVVSGVVAFDSGSEPM